MHIATISKQKKVIFGKCKFHLTPKVNEMLIHFSVWRIGRWIKIKSVLFINHLTLYGQRVAYAIC